LNFAGNGRRGPIADLPSWVPDWKCISQSGLYNKTYTAVTKHPTSLLGLPDHPKIPFVKGWTCDTVNLLSDVIYISTVSANPLDLGALKAWYKTVMFMIMQNVTAYPYDKRFKVYIYTMLGYQSPDAYA